MNEQKKNQEQYKKSHGCYEPGEQKHRNYNWPVDPATHYFGKDFKGATNEARFILKPEDQPQSFPQTKIISKRVEDCKNFKDDPLGRTKNLG